MWLQTALKGVQLTPGTLYAKQARRTSLLDSIALIPVTNSVLSVADERAGGQGGFEGK